jgi:acyl-CoA synthetase (NDP forming)
MMSRRAEGEGIEVDGFIVQRMAPKGVEMLVGVVHDPLFGPVIACGAGGTKAEVLNDVALRIIPVTDADAKSMLRSLKTFRLLDGFRGEPPADVDALEEVILRIAELSEEQPEIAELDLNPVIAAPEGAMVVDARIRVAPADPSPPFPSIAAQQ